MVARSIDQRTVQSSAWQGLAAQRFEEAAVHKDGGWALIPHEGDGYAPIPRKDDACRGMTHHVPLPHSLLAALDCRPKSTSPIG